MIALTTLWLPILVSAALVFIMSSLIHMLTGWHNSDYAKVSNEDKVMDALRPFAIPPGDYFVPRAGSMEEMKSAEYQERVAKGPMLVMTVFPNGPMAMGRTMSQWFVYSLVVSVIAGYVGGRALDSGATYLQVFRFVGVTAFCCYSLALWQFAIWYRRSTLTTIKSTIDGLLYALLTAGAFGWLWPR
jgi:hypothetical protein